MSKESCQGQGKKDQKSSTLPLGEFRWQVGSWTEDSSTVNLLCFLHFFCLKSIPKLNDSTHRTHESNLKSQRTQRPLSWLHSDSPEISVRFGFDSNMFIGFIVVYKSEFTQRNAQNMHSIKNLFAL